MRLTHPGRQRPPVGLLPTSYSVQGVRRLGIRVDSISTFACKSEGRNGRSSIPVSKLVAGMSFKLCQTGHHGAPTGLAGYAGMPGGQRQGGGFAWTRSLSKLCPPMRTRTRMRAREGPTRRVHLTLVGFHQGKIAPPRQRILGTYCGIDQGDGDGYGSGAVTGDTSVWQDG
jgi:hypothetical protein